jgi:hypothetical protein
MNKPLGPHRTVEGRAAIHGSGTYSQDLIPATAPVSRWAERREAGRWPRLAHFLVGYLAVGY